MNSKSLFTTLLAVALATAACTTPVVSNGTPTSTITPDDKGPVSTGTTFVGDREVAVIDCADATKDEAIVCESFDLIKAHYVDEVSDSTLVEAATEGLGTLDGADSEQPLECAVPTDEFATACDVAAVTADDGAEAAAAMVAGFTAFALDPHSAYFDKAALDLLQEEQLGEIEGIGAIVSPEDETVEGDNKTCGIVSTTCQILIVSTIEGSPAEAAGLMRDDRVMAVDGTSIVGWTVDEVTSAVRGPSGTEVTLTIERGSEDLDISITRTAIEIPVIEKEVVGGVGYVRLWNFTGNAGPQFESAIVDLLAEGVDEILFDLRNNPGGFLSTAIDVTSVFLNNGDVVETQGPDGTEDYPVNGGAVVPEDMDVTIVVNRGSASASEVVSATLQERGRATIVGENTFGKNTVQQRFGLSNGGALKLTIARWLTPGGHDFGGSGVAPDVRLDVNGLTPTELVDAIAG